MKGEYEIRDIISQFAKEISYYSRMEALGVTPYEKNYHQNLIKERTEDLIYVMERYTAKEGSPVMQQFPENIPESVPELPTEVAPPPLGVPEQAPETEAAPVPGVTEPIPAPEAPAAVPAPQVPGSAPGTAPPEQRVFTLEELNYYNGVDGRPAYVAVNGVVYDVSQRIGWAGGTHFGLYSGNDLTRQFIACHRGLTTVIEQLPVVGILVSD